MFQFLFTPWFFMYLFCFDNYINIVQCSVLNIRDTNTETRGKSLMNWMFSTVRSTYWSFLTGWYGPILLWHDVRMAATLQNISKACDSFGLVEVHIALTPPLQMSSRSACMLLLAAHKSRAVWRTPYYGSAH
jgi:hypothetical protein